MNEQLFRTLLKRYEAVIEDCLYKIQALNENNLVIPEHVDITGEVDKLLQTMSEAEDKVAVMRKYYVENKADKQVLQPVYMYGKKNKKKNKNYSRKSVILSLSSRSIDFIDFRVDTQVDILCLR